jgi:hypothetical protein
MFNEVTGILLDDNIVAKRDILYHQLGESEQCGIKVTPQTITTEFHVVSLPHHGQWQ